ncbi:MAG: ParB/RepB/Spo0J family partition protein [Oscillospiraceae bacterium]
MNFPFIAKEKVINKVIEIPMEKIKANPYQPRTVFGDDISELAESIKQNGLLQPLTVKTEEDSYIIIAGERRFRALRMLGRTTAPCIVMDVTDRNSAILALVENIQRKDLHFFDEAEALSKLLDFYGMTQEDAAIRLGKTQSTVANKLRLLKLTETVRNKIRACGLTERHARALLKLASESLQLEAVENIVARRYNVEQTERLVAAMIDRENERESIRRRSGAFKDIRLFVNTINKAVEMMKAAGINADSQKIKENGYIEYIVRIPTEH